MWKQEQTIGTVDSVYKGDGSGNEDGGDGSGGEDGSDDGDGSGGVDLGTCAHSPAT